MDTHESSQSLSIYDTIEHDMRHSKEYLANIKFNYIEVLHKSIFLKRLRGQTETEVESSKEALVETKKQIEEQRKKFEKISEEVMLLREKEEKQENALRRAREREALLKKRINEITKTEKTLKEFSEIKRDHGVRMESVKNLREKITKAESTLKVGKTSVESKAPIKDSLIQQRAHLQERLKDLQKTANQQLVYQYNWYKQFMSLFYKLVGIRVIDVRQSVYKHQETTYNSTEGRGQKKKDDTNEISIKFLSKKNESTVVITLIFVDGKVCKYGVHKTEGTLQIEPVSCDTLFNYCKKVNSTKYFIFESIYQQLSNKEHRPRQMNLK